MRAFLTQPSWNRLKISRRSFLKQGLGAGVALCLPFSLAEGQARNTVREFRFSASKTRVNLGTGTSFWAYTYNGQIPGPEIRVREGEVIRVILKNYLPEGTTIHWHGIPLPNAMDGVPGITQNPIMPGETFTYEFQAGPAGSFIYHSHSKYQLDQGLYGPLVIEPNHSNESYDREYTLMLEDWVMKDGGGVAGAKRNPPMGMMHGKRGMRRRFRQAAQPLLEPIYNAYAVNGKISQSIVPIRVKKGERIKLRLMNPSAATIYELRLAGHTMTVTHADGNPIRPIQTDVIRIGMGERYDVMVEADNPGFWLLAARETGWGESSLQIPVLYTGIQQKQTIRPTFYPGLRFASYHDFRRAEPAETMTEAFDRSYFQMLSGGMHTPYWTINGRIYPDAETLGVWKGETVRIHYRNHSMMPHPMHLHGHFFKVVNPRIPKELWILKDTLNVDPMQEAAVEFFADNPGKWFHHCHNLYHMEAGMANTVVYA
jgi:FtsP/CotA-like multicopper oxidase with cupredoxin domain